MKFLADYGSLLGKNLSKIFLYVNCLFVSILPQNGNGSEFTFLPKFENNLTSPSDSGFCFFTKTHKRECPLSKIEKNKIPKSSNFRIPTRKKDQIEKTFRKIKCRLLILQISTIFDFEIYSLTTLFPSNLRLSLIEYIFEGHLNTFMVI